MKNQISFTGIYNIASVEFLKKYPSESLSMTLKNDFNGKTLDEFKKLVKKSEISDFINPKYKDLLNIEKVSNEMSGKDEFFINGSSLECNDKNLPIFTFIAKLTRKIVNMADKDFVVNQDYKNYCADETLIAGSKISSFCDTSAANFFDQFFDKTNIKNTARNINSGIDKIMKNYFDI